MEISHIFQCRHEVKVLTEACLILTTFDDNPVHQIISLLIDALTDVTMTGIVLNNVAHYLAEAHGLTQINATNILNAAAQLLTVMVLELQGLGYGNAKMIYLTTTYPYVVVNIGF
jgi:hypothetical protein